MGAILARGLVTKSMAFTVHTAFAGTADRSAELLQWTSTHFEVVRDEELGRPEEVEDVAEHVSIPVNEVVLLQAVQDYGLRPIKETTDSAHTEGRGRETGLAGGTRSQGNARFTQQYSSAQHKTRHVTSAVKRGGRQRWYGRVRPAGCRCPEAACQSPSGPRLGASLRPLALQMARALWPSTAAVTSAIITKLLLSARCVRHLFTARNNWGTMAIQKQRRQERLRASCLRTASFCPPDARMGCFSDVMGCDIWLFNVTG